MELSIDASTAAASIALSEKGFLQAEYTWRVGQSHSTQLLPAIEHLLQQAGTSIAAIEGIIVARGPGSYSGLRVAMSTAKGLAFARGIPLTSATTLEVAAYPHAPAGLPVCAILDGGRGELAAAIYRLDDRQWQRLLEEQLTTVEALAACVEERTLFCGEIAPSVAQRLTEALGERAIIISGGAEMRRAGYLAALGWMRLATGDFDDLATLQPLYLRRPAITEPKRDPFQARG